LEKNLILAHKENDYIDFDFEGLILKELSQEGPAMWNMWDG
jgi:hypothetical protein